MITEHSIRVLLVGRQPDWRQATAAHLREHGFPVEVEPDNHSAVNIINDDATITVAVFSEDQDRDGLFFALARIALIRPHLTIIVLAYKYDTSAMVRYLHLGQRDDGEGRVHYLVNDYDNDRLVSMINETSVGVSTPCLIDARG